MARFIVGPNDWNFRDAYQQASDGDILELQDNTRVDLGSSVFQINKSLEIVGQMTVAKDLLLYRRSNCYYQLSSGYFTPDNLSG